jgi:hypothetical protein
MGESSESIYARVQTARDIQIKRFSKNGSSDIICKAEIRLGEIRQFCRLQDKRLAWSRVEAPELDPRTDGSAPFVGAYDCGFGRCAAIPSQVDDGLTCIEL